MPISAVIGAVGAVGGGLIAANGAKSAANTQANAANAAAAQQQAAGQKAIGYLGAGQDSYNALMAPYLAQGQANTDLLNSKMGYLTTPFAPTQAQLEATPGYQFTLSQGLKATQNAQAAQGLGVSGSALKAAAQYATGLADNTYQNQAQLYGQQQGQIGNLLTTLNANNQNLAQGVGSTNYNYNAAKGNALTGQANQAAQTSMAGAQASAAGQVGAANALSGALQGAASGIGQAGVLSAVMAQNGKSGVTNPFYASMGFA